MSVEIVGTDEFAQWYIALSVGDTKSVDRYIALLERKGVLLGSPYSSAIRGSRYAFRELRVQSSGRPIRIFYAFDPDRQAVLLLGGDKTGADRFYETYLPRAEVLWNQYLIDIRHEKNR